jgi:sugar lactone lactonase YvrE
VKSPKPINHTIQISPKLTLHTQGRDLNPYGAPTQPTLYFVNGTTMRAKELISLEGNTNGVSISPDGKTIYLSDTGASDSSIKPSRRNFRGPRDLWAWDFAFSAAGEKLPVLTNRRLINRALQYFYDGVRASSNGLIFGAGGEVVDVVDPESGWTLGSIRMGGNGNDPVNIVLGEHELWVVGKGGVWHVKNVKEKLAQKYD